MNASVVAEFGYNNFIFFKKKKLLHLHKKCESFKRCSVEKISLNDVRYFLKNESVEKILFLLKFYLTLFSFIDIVDYLEYRIVRASIRFQDLDFDSKYIWTMDPKASPPGSGDPSPIVRRTIIIVSCGPPIVMAHSPSTSYWSFVFFEDQFWFSVLNPHAK